MRALLFSGLALLGVGCSAETFEPVEADIQEQLLSTRRISIADDNQPLSGLWASRGFGWIIDLDEGFPLVYETGAFGCYARPMSVDGKTSMLSVSYEDYHLNSDGSVAMLMFGPDQVGPVFDRIDQLPETCASKPNRSPEHTLDVFLSIMGTHYAHFENRGVDWTSLKDDARLIYSNDPSEEGLKSAMRKVIETVDDSHTRVIAFEADGSRDRIGAGKGPTLSMIEALDAEGPWLIGILQQLKQKVLDEGAQHVGNDRVVWGTIDNQVGYLKLFTMGGFTELDIGDEGWMSAELSEMDRIFDEVFQHFADQQIGALILDLSNNRGGYDEISRRLAARFTNEPFYAYSTLAKGSGLNILRKTIQPADSNRFTGPVFVLTSDVTVSGGEIATLAMRQLPNVTQVGTSTRGSFSTPLPKSLPNGWILELANETFADPTGEVYAGRGLPPDQGIVVFDKEDPVASHGAAIEQILKIIRSEAN